MDDDKRVPATWEPADPKVYQDGQKKIKSHNLTEITLPENPIETCSTKSYYRDCSRRRIPSQEGRTKSVWDSSFL